MKKLILLLFFLVSVTACLPQGRFGIAIPVEFFSAGVCSGVELTSNNDSLTGIGYIQAKEGRVDGVTFVKGQTVLIPQPNPQPRPTWYGLGTEPAVSGQQFAVDVTWRCLPDRSPVNVKFVYLAGERIEKGLRITENAASPNGFDVVVTDFPR